MHCSSPPFAQELHKSDAPPTVTLCDVLQSPEKYDSREIVTSGVAGNSFHQAVFFEPECSLPRNGGAMSVTFGHSYKLGQPMDKRYFTTLRKQGAIRVQLRGRFIASGGPFGPEGTKYEFVILEVLDVQKLSREYRQRYSIGTGRTVPD
jgi:hypothetical protein